MNIQYRLIGFLKAFLIIFTCILGGILVVATADKQGMANAAENESVSVLSSSDFDIIILNNKGYRKDRKEPVKFPHRKHGEDNKLTCWECHHVYKNGENIYSPWGKTDKCIACHDPLKVQDKAVKLQKAYHLSCKGCHKAQYINTKDPSAYRNCFKCHVKNKRGR